MAGNSEERREHIEWLKSSQSIEYWIETYVQIYNATTREWLPFALWPAQVETLETLRDTHQLIILKARQLGLSWLTLCYVLWQMLFRKEATILIFSKRDEEAVELLDNRLKGIHQRLPSWMQARAIQADDKHTWALSNGSSAKAFPTTGGRSYTGSIVLVDEADFIQDLDALLNAVKPTVDAGGQLILISTVDKSKPQSPFKRIYRGAKRGHTEWVPVFLPWHARPERDEAFYVAQRADVYARTGALDDLHQEYPATDTEALAPRTLDKRIPAPWIEQCYVEMEPLDSHPGPALPGLEVYVLPQPGRRYVIGADPAEGNPTSDDSALCVMDVVTGEECAALAGKFEPSTLAEYADQVGRWYNHAALLSERNNHGHAVLLWWEEHTRLTVLKGDDDKPGWLSNRLGKTLLYNSMAETFRDGNTILHSFAGYTQLASIEGSTLLAPDGEHDDRADSYALANIARSLQAASTVQIAPRAASLYGSRQQANAQRPAAQKTRTGGLYGSRR
jgi:hypothetical protein